MTEFFDSLLSLEDEYYKEGYKEGCADGTRVGLVEGRTFGLEKGYSKFLELGRLQGRTSVWRARGADIEGKNPRAKKQIDTLALTLVHPPFENDEESVGEVEELLKRGRAKTKIIERMLGETDTSTANDSRGKSSRREEQNIEDFVPNDIKTI